MTDEEMGMTALMIPALESTTELIPMDVRPAARDHLLAWDASQRLVAIHESGHAAACGALSIPCRAVDITHRFGGMTQLGSPMEDTALPWETSQRNLDRIVVTLCGSAAERVVLGEHTNGGESDLDAAVGLAMKWIQAGFAGKSTFVGQDGLPFGYLTEAVKTRTIKRIEEVVADAQMPRGRAHDQAPGGHSHHRHGRL